MDNAGRDDDAKRTVVLKLHSHPYIQQLLLQRCGISPRWLDDKRARFLSRRTRQYSHTPAFTRYAVELLGPRPRRLLHDRRRASNSGAHARGKSQVRRCLAGRGLRSRSRRSRDVGAGVPGQPPTAEPEMVAHNAGDNDHADKSTATGPIASNTVPASLRARCFPDRPVDTLAPLIVRTQFTSARPFFACSSPAGAVFQVDGR